LGETKTSIREWPADDRPREKLIRYGADALSNAELLAILMRSGYRDMSALSLGRHLLRSCGGIENMGRMTAGALSRQKGIGPAKAAGLVAAFQLGARYSEAVTIQIMPVVRGPKVISDIYGERLRLLTHEVCKVILMDQSNHAFKDFDISAGSLNSSVVHPREVFKPAIDHLAAAIILMHNHPSGELIPSREDVLITQKIRESGNIIGISLLDHIIVSRKGYLSMKEKGYI